MKKTVLIPFICLITFSYCGRYGVSTPVAPSYSCTEPLTYFIRDVDPAFGITSQELKETIHQAANVWHEEVGRELFVYSEKGEIAVDLVYDERQIFENKVGTYTQKLDSLGSIKDSMKVVNDRLKKKIAASDYLVMKELYKDKIEKLEMRYEQLKEKNEISDEFIEQYNKEQASLIEFWASIEQKRETYNAEVNKFNQDVSEYNKIVDEYNALVHTSNSMKRHYYSQFDGNVPPQGTYSWNGEEKKIEIFHFSDRQDLKLTLTHEIGHALGIIHSADSTSVMSSSSYSPSDTEIILSEYDKSAIWENCSGKMMSFND